MNYDWTPISEPPSDGRDILLWIGTENYSNDWTCNGDGFFTIGMYEEEFITFETANNRPNQIKRITHWKDIEPPK